MPKKQPNVLFICDDQHHPDIVGYRGHPNADTPHIDKLAAEGAYFTRAYCNCPICTPSRMSYLTGQYIHDIDVWNNNWPLDRELPTFASELDAAGVETTMLGKMDLCGEYQDGGFRNVRIFRRRPVDATMSEEGPWLTEPFWGRLPGAWRKWRPASRAIAHAGPRTERLIGDGTHADQDDDCLGNWEHDRRVADFAVEFLQEKGERRQSGQDANDEPWLCYVGFVYPHAPYITPTPCFDRYWPDNTSLPVDARFPNPDLHPALARYQEANHTGQPSEESLLRMRAAYMGSISCVDDLVGDILGELEAQGLADDTIVIYTSDHGDTAGDHGVFFKKSPYEGSVGVPLVVRGPGIEPGTRIDDVVSLIDIYPTLMDVFGVESQADLQGESWLPLLRGESRPDATAFAEFHAWFFPDNWLGVINGDNKYVWVSDQRPMLFNLREDPHELNDLATDPAYASVLADMEARLREVCDPEAVTLAGKKAMGLIGPDGEDYTKTRRARMDNLEEPNEEIPM